MLCIRVQVAVMMVTAHFAGPVHGIAASNACWGLFDAVHGALARSMSCDCRRVI